MSSGKTHGRVTVLTGGMAATAVALAYSPIAGGYLLCGSLLGLIVEPDLDVNGITQSETRIIRPLRGLWRIYWYPYALAIKHRSMWSHAPLLGTFIRLCYLFWLPFLAAVYYGYTGVLASYAPEIGWVILGLILSDFMHWVFDYL